MQCFFSSEKNADRNSVPTCPGEIKSLLHGLFLSRKKVQDTVQAEKSPASMPNRCINNDVDEFDV